MNSDLSVCDIFSNCLKLREELIFTFQTTNGQEYYTLNDPLHSRYFRVGPAEYTFLTLLDGHSTVQECYSRISTAMPLHHLTNDDIAGLCQWAIRMDLVRHQHARFRQQNLSSRNTKSDKSKFNLIVFCFPLGKPDPVFARAERACGWLFSQPALIGWVMILLFAIFRIGVNWTNFYNSSKTILSTDNWLWLAGCWVFLKLIHESAHAIVCKRYHGTVREAGVLFILFAPLPYVDVTSCWNFPSRMARMHVAAAGLYIELFIAAIAACVWGHSSQAWLNQLCFNIVVAASVSNLLFNMNPLMKFDGYYILTDLLGIPNLYTNGQLWLRQWAKRVFLGVNSQLPDWSTRDRLITAIYGIASYIWRVIVCISLIVTAATFLEGAGIILSLVAIGLWVIEPVCRCAKYIAFGNSGSAPNRTRFILVSGALMMFTFLVFRYVPWIGNFQAPAIVEYAPLSVKHAEIPGFISEIHVISGQQVQQGQTLIQLQNPELEVEIAQLKIEIEKSELRIHQSEQKRQIADLQVEQEVLHSLQSKLSEKQTLFDQLTIRSEINGRIVTRNLESKRGTYVNQGDTIISVGDDTHKELHVAVAQNDLEHFMKAPGQTVMVHIPQQSLLPCPIEKVVPRATVALNHPALAASYGGDLPVKPVSSNATQKEFELLEPRFNIIVSLDTEKCSELRAGQRVAVTCRPTSYSIGQYLQKSVSDWFYNRLEQ